MDSRAHSSPPAAREEGLLVEEIGDEKVVYDVETKDAHALGALAAAVFAGSDGRRSLAELASFAAEHTGESVTEDQVWDALVQLEERNLLKPPTGGMSRRGFVRKSAAGVAITVPLITSLAMPSIASAASCNIGATCDQTNKASCGTVPMCDGAPGGCNTCECVGSDSGSTAGYTSCAGGACTGLTVTPGHCGWV
jgi:hypothetical protein